MNLYLDKTCLCFRKIFYRQTFGVAMGFPISVIVASLDIESIKNRMLKDFVFPPRLWLRYIDDTFVVLKKTKLHLFINSLILNIEDSIKFKLNIKLIMLFLLLTIVSD